MGTRGAVGFRIDGIDKLAYNHADSYPSGLGSDVVDFVRGFLGLGVEGMREAARAVELVNTAVPPTPEQQERFMSIANLGVGRQSLNDWYCLLRELQGDLGGYIDQKVMPKGGEDFLRDSLFCEWAYIVNLDDMTFEVYRGFQKAKHSAGRYADLPKADDVEGYFPVALAAAFDLSEIPSDWVSHVDPDEES